MDKSKVPRFLWPTVYVFSILTYSSDTTACRNPLTHLSCLLHRNEKSSPFFHHRHHFWQAPLRVRSVERRHQSPEWTDLRQVNCVVHIEVAGFQVLLNGFHPCNTRTSQWSRPVSFFPSFGHLKINKIIQNSLLPDAASMVQNALKYICSLAGLKAGLLLRGAKGKGEGAYPQTKIYYILHR